MSFPVEPLGAILGVKVTRGAMLRPRTGGLTDTGAMFCAHIGLAPGRLASVLDPRRRGLTLWEADVAACRLGRHPLSIWPEWATDPVGYPK